MSDLNKIISANDYNEGSANFFKGLNSDTSLVRGTKDWSTVDTNDAILQKSVAVSPSDSTVLSVTQALWVGTSGNVAVVHHGDSSAVTYRNVSSGTLLPIQVTKVMSTNTTASNILAIYLG